MHETEKDPTELKKKTRSKWPIWIFGASRVWPPAIGRHPSSVTGAASPATHGPKKNSEIETKHFHEFSVLGPKQKKMRVDDSAGQEPRNTRENKKNKKDELMSPDLMAFFVGASGSRALAAAASGHPCLFLG